MSSVTTNHPKLITKSSFIYKTRVLTEISYYIYKVNSQKQINLIKIV